MNDKELADAVVALGVGKYHPRTNEAGIHVSSYSGLSINGHEIDGTEERVNSAITILVTPYDKFVRDWRVAGALMEKCATGEYSVLSDNEWSALMNDDHQSWNESLPRAIIEACVSALSE